MSKMKLGVIFGGMSTEHDVSIVSGTAVIKNLNKDKYEITPMYIDQNGDWYFYKKDINEIDLLKLGETPKEIEKIENVMETLKEQEVIFPVLHGLYGEDGTIQGLFELLKVPYVGCRVLASSLCMDKVYTKVILDKAKIKQADYVYVRKYDDKYIYVDNNFNESIYDVEELCDKVIEQCGLPLFIKPSNSGSSVGINKANNKEELKNAVEYAAKFDKKILIEENINGREIECAVIGNENVDASCVGEILPAEEFYSFDAKYNNSESRVVIPANISEEISEEIRKIAKKAYKALDCKGLSRVDFFVEKTTGEIYLNEINTLPGFTTISMYPQLWAKCGKQYSDLLDELIKNALEF
ncbi:MAG: D-alanine--D-alanine ligase [Clostridia bacterium]|nr:D-alanine--D-alanine ligase [Clostridia bacterium]